MKVVVVASHLFAPTHHGLARMAAALAARVDLELLGKHPLPYADAGDARLSMPVPRQLPRLDGPWTPAADVVHCLGGGETAITVASALRRVPLVVSFVGAADLTRQLDDPALAAGYDRLFRRAQFVTCPDAGDAARLLARGVPADRLVLLPASLTLPAYRPRLADAPRRAIVAARAIRRKNHALAIDAARQALRLDTLFVVGHDAPGGARRCRSFDILPHAQLLSLMRRCRVLLQTAEWRGTEVDTLPVIVLEALAMGLSVVSTPLRGVMPLAQQFPTRVRTATTARGLAAALDEALDGEDGEGARAAAEHVSGAYRFEEAVDRVQALYRRAAGGV